MNRKYTRTGLALLYTSVSTGIFFKYFYYEEISPWTTFMVPVILFAPVLLNGLKNVDFLAINISVILGFAVGFIYVAFIQDNNIWPIALVIWLILSLPALVFLNLLSMVGRKIGKA